jgi:hypothetical protein
MAALMVVDHPVAVRNCLAAPLIASIESAIDTPSRIDLDDRIDDQDFFWLIGILEGEGTFLAASPSGRGIPVVRVSMTDRDVVDRVGRLIERAVVPVRKRRVHHKTPYVTTIKGAPAVLLMRAIYPYMGTYRQPQIERAIASWHGHRMRWPRTSAPCAASNCSRAGARRGLCLRHYDRWWKAARRGHKTEVAPFDPPGQTLGPVGDGAAFGEACTLAWIAGLLEGEGTFSVDRQSADIAYPVIKLEMCDEAVVICAAKVLGAPSVRRVDPEKEDWSPTFVAAITGHDAATWMRRLRSSMGTRRTAAIDAALAQYHPIRLIDPPALCVVAGCGGVHRGRGLCHKHYMMWSRDKAKGRVARIAPLR